MIATLAQAAQISAEDPAQPGVTLNKMLNIFNGYVIIFAIAFLVTLIATPIMRQLAIRNNVIDRPNDPRKAHKIPVAYLGGVAVFLGVLAAIAIAYMGDLLPEQLLHFHESQKLEDAWDRPVVPIAILIGMAAITVTGLIDDVTGLDPRLKIVGQLIAAAFLALEDFGVRVAEGLMLPVADWLSLPRVEGTWQFGVLSVPDHQAAFSTIDAMRDTIGMNIPAPEAIVPTGFLSIDLIYWIGTAIIAIFVLGACNASNLIDGLDGLLSGVTAIAAAGLLVIAIYLAAIDDGYRDAGRIILCLALMGACMGFLPHNFNPATIFLGDCGSLLLGYLTIVIVLSLGDTGRTELVVAGLIIFAIPIIDTILAVVRRKMAGKPMSAPDDQHLHHMLKRRFGVRGAVMVLYALAAAFALIGVWLSLATTIRLVFTIAMVFAGFVGVTAVKFARRAAIEAQIMDLASASPSASPAAEKATPSSSADPTPGAPRSSGPAPPGQSATSTDLSS